MEMSHCCNQETELCKKAGKHFAPNLTCFLKKNTVLCGEAFYFQETLRFRDDFVLLLQVHLLPFCMISIRTLVSLNHLLLTAINNFFLILIAVTNVQINANIDFAMWEDQLEAQMKAITFCVI